MQNKFSLIYWSFLLTGKRKYNRGMHVDGQWVFGGCEKNDSTKMFLVPVENRTKATLLPLIQRWILPGSIISSGMYMFWLYIKLFETICVNKKCLQHLHFMFPFPDCWKPYASISSLPEQYSHQTVNHSVEFKADDGTCTNTIEGSWRHLKRSIPHATRKTEYAGYLAEYLWRKSHRGEDMFQAFAADVAQVFKPV